MCTRQQQQQQKKTAYVVFSHLWENEMQWACDAQPQPQALKTEHADVGSLFLFQPLKKHTKLKHLGTVLHVRSAVSVWATYMFLSFKCCVHPLSCFTMKVLRSRMSQRPSRRHVMVLLKWSNPLQESPVTQCFWI